VGKSLSDAFSRRRFSNFFGQWEQGFEPPRRQGVIRGKSAPKVPFFTPLPSPPNCRRASPELYPPWRARIRPTAGGQARPTTGGQALPAVAGRTPKPRFTP